MPQFSSVVLAALLAVSGSALAQRQTLAEIPAQSRTVLSKDEVTTLMTGAKMRRVNGQGSTQAWTNETDGTFVVSSDNRGTQGGNSTAQGKWKVSDEGRYCITMEWRGNPKEEWCRLVIKTDDGYYVTNSDKSETERIHKLDISK